MGTVQGHEKGQSEEWELLSRPGGRGLTLAGAPVLSGMKEEGGSSSGLGLASEGTFRPGLLGRAPVKKGLVREVPAGQASPWPCS